MTLRCDGNPVLQIRRCNCFRRPASTSATGQRRIEATFRTNPSSSDPKNAFLVHQARGKPTSCSRHVQLASNVQEGFARCALPRLQARRWCCRRGRVRASNVSTLPILAVQSESLLTAMHGSGREVWSLSILTIAQSAGVVLTIPKSWYRLHTRFDREAAWQTFFTCANGRWDSQGGSGSILARSRGMS